MEVEALAKALHEAGRAAVVTGKVLVKDPQGRPFIEWDQLPEDAREGRRIMARYVMEHFIIYPKKK